MAEEPIIQESNNPNNENNQDNAVAEAETKSTSKIQKTQPTPTAQKQPNDDINLCCRDCIRWDKYGEKCFYWWKGKKYCSRRVTSIEELEHENLFLG